MPSPARSGFWTYVKEAFKQHWNLLFFGGATVAALISPVPDVAVPLVMAAELTYLTGLAGHPKFRAVVDRKQAEAARGPAPTAESQASEARAAYDRVLSSLTPKARARFVALKTRCVEMQRLAANMQGNAPSMEDHQTPALNRMLWIFLRLLASEVALDRFLSQTNIDAIESQLADLRARQNAGVTDDRIARSLVDGIATLELRRDNHSQAKTNRDLVDLELNRIESKIQALVEMGISHEDPDYITSQLDSVTRSWHDTQMSLGDLTNLPGLGAMKTVEAPSIMALETVEIDEEVEA
jgi:hypothetical protein